jgi:pimeloyl-ACP methyl ester carboxylesterase
LPIAQIWIAACRLGHARGRHYAAPVQPELLRLDCPTPAGVLPVAARQWGTPGAPAVVCVHGLSRNASDFDALGGALAPRMRVVSIDMPGRGDSPCLADPAGYREATYLAVARHVIDTLGLGAVAWVGTSMGGLLGMKLAASEPARLRALVLNDVGAELDGPELARLRREAAMEVEFADLDEAEAHFRRRYEAFGPLPDERWRHLARHGVWRLDSGRLRPAFDPRAVDPGPLPARVDLWKVWGAVRCPSLVILGGRSRLIDRSVCERMAATGPAARWIEIPQAGHAPDLYGPERIAPVAAFLEGTAR